MPNKLTDDQVIKRFNQIHGSRYDYSKVVYNGTMNNVDIICRVHGVFQQTPDNHKRGQGCPRCRPLTGRKSQSEVIGKFNDIHGDKYNYDKVQYTSIDAKITITCPIHGDFDQSPYCHIKGQGCKKCADESNMGGYSHLSETQLVNIKPAFMYRVKLSYNGESFGKIGITTSPMRRFREFSPYKVIESELIEFDNMLEAFMCEFDELNRLNKYKPIHHFGGSGECYMVESE